VPKSMKSDEEPPRKRRSDVADLATQNLLDSRRLFYFFHVARAGSFTAAETILDVAQSTMSRQIQQLESEVGAKLLQRTGRGVALTHAGEILYRHAEEILREMSNTLEQIALDQKSARGQIAIAASRPFSSRYIPEVLYRFAEKYPDVHLTALEASSGQVYQYLADGAVDFAVVLHTPNSHKITTHKLLVEPLLLVARHDDPVLASSVVERDTLTTLKLMLPAASHGTRAIIERYLDDGGQSLDPTLRLDSVSLMKAIIRQGRYCALLPAMACEAELASGAFGARPLKPPLERTLYLASLRDRPQTPILKAMEREIMAVVRGKPGEPVDER
jgi:DNA-binding transcriptional LysR family regulator